MNNIENITYDTLAATCAWTWRPAKFWVRWRVRGTGCMWLRQRVIGSLTGNVFRWYPGWLDRGLGETEGLKPAIDLMPVLVTGGTGFIGGAIVRELLRRGRAVRWPGGQLRRRKLPTFKLDIAYGNILDRSSIKKGPGGLRHAVSYGSHYEFWVPDEQTLMRTEIEGTRNAMDRPRRDLKKVVYTSTRLASVRALSETRRRPTGVYFLSRYERAKYEAERTVKAYGREGCRLLL